MMPYSLCTRIAFRVTPYGYYISPKVWRDSYLSIVRYRLKVWFSWWKGVEESGLEQTERAGARHRFGAVFDLEFVKERAIVSFDSA